MNSFASAVESVYQNPEVMGVTANGMPALATTSNALVDLFFVIGSARKVDISAKFKAALNVDPVLTLQMLFWARDVRGGAGERDTFRKLMKVVEVENPHTALTLIPLIPEYGRWDDLSSFENPIVRKAALRYWAEAIWLKEDALAAKWAPRKGVLANELRKSMGMGMSPKTYRKTLVSLTQAVETAMCAKDWGSINYSHVPSVASSRYAKAFGRHDPVRYTEFKAAALKGDVNINSGALYPYDVLRNVDHGDFATALAQWQNLPNFLGDAGMILPMIDTSGSMDCAVGGAQGKSLTCMQVAISLGLYLADKQQGPFANMFLNFDTQSRIHKLEGNLLEKYNQIRHCKWGGSTNLESAFKEILRVAVQGQVSSDQMPSTLLIISDMGFDPYIGGINKTAMQMAQEKYERHNYQIPTIVWWNVAHRPGGYGGDNNFPVKDTDTNTALVSGFSPSILKSVLSSKNITPWDVMIETLSSQRYQAVRDVLTA